MFYRTIFACDPNLYSALAFAFWQVKRGDSNSVLGGEQ